MSEVNLNTTNLASQLYTQLQGAESSEKTEKVAATAVADLLSTLAPGGNVKVSQVGAQVGASRAIAVPDLDEADAELAEKADLEVLIAYLQMDMDETQAAAANQRIESMKGKLKQAHDLQLSRINEAVEAAKKQEKASAVSKWLSRIGVVFAFITAVATTVFSGGALAAVAWVGFGLAAASLTMSETKLDQKLINVMAESLHKNNGLSRQTAEAVAQGIYAGVQFVLSIVCAIGGGFATGASKAAEVGAKTVQASQSVMKLIYTATSASMGVANAAASGVSMGFNYHAGSKQAEVTEAQGFTLKIQKILEECQEDLENILSLLNDAGGKVMTLIESKIDTNARIASAIGMSNA